MHLRTTLNTSSISLKKKKKEFALSVAKLFREEELHMMQYS